MQPLHPHLDCKAYPEHQRPWFLCCRRSLTAAPLSTLHLRLASGSTFMLASQRHWRTDWIHIFFLCSWERNALVRLRRGVHLICRSCILLPCNHLKVSMHAWALACAWACNNAYYVDQLLGSVFGLCIHTHLAYREHEIWPSKLYINVQIIARIHFQNAVMFICVVSVCCKLDFGLQY